MSELLSPGLLERTANDLRGPATVLGFVVDEAAAGQQISPELAARGRRALQRLSNIADRLSRVAQLTLDRDPPAFERVDAVAAVRAGVERARRLEARAAVAVEIGGDARWLVDAAPHQLAVALGDVISAALRRARGRVDITVDAPGLRILVGDDGVRSTKDADVFVDLPFVLAAATLARQGFRLVVDDPAEDAGLRRGGRVVVLLAP